MVSKAKLYSQLDRLEDELRERLVPHLTAASLGNNDLVFCTSEFNTFSALKNHVDTETEALIVLGRQILALREKLDEPTEATVAERICWYCREWGDTVDQHRNPAQALASQFLQEIGGTQA